MEGADPVPKSNQANDRRSILVFSVIAGVIAGLCCLTPIVLVMLGLATVSVAADLGNVLYGEYRWVFRGTALAFLAVGLLFYFRKRGICTLDQARHQRHRILNVSLVVLTAASGIYLFWTYIVLHYWGIAAGLPWAQYKENWAIPAVVVLFALFFLLIRRVP